MGRAPPPCRSSPAAHADDRNPERWDCDCGGPLIAWFTDPAANVLWSSRRDGTLGRDRETVRSRGRRATRLLAHGIAKAFSRSMAMTSIRSATVWSNSTDSTTGTPARRLYPTR